MQASVAVAPGPGQVPLQCPLIHPRLENLSIFEPEHNKNAGLSYRNMTGVSILCYRGVTASLLETHTALFDI